MIQVTRLNGRRMVINAEQIKYVEQTPDTMVTLMSGDRVAVQESMEQVVLRAIEYGRSFRRSRFTPDPRSTGPVQP